MVQDSQVKEGGVKDGGIEVRVVYVGGAGADVVEVQEVDQGQELAFLLWSPDSLHFLLIQPQLGSLLENTRSGTA